MANTLTITGATTLKQLDTFLKTEANADHKILARQNKDGETVLYAKTKATTILDTLLGRTARRQERAREAVQSVFDRFEQANPKAGNVSRRGADILFEYVSKSLTDKAKGAGMTAGELRGLVSAAKTILRDIPAGTSTQAAQVPSGPTLQSVGLPGAAISTAADYLASAIKTKADAEPVANVLGDRIAREFQSRHGDAASCEAFGLSDGVTLKSELKRALAEALQAMQPAPAFSDDVMDEFVDKAFNRAASQMLDDGAVANTSTMIKNVKLPNITLGGQEYKPTGFLGQGGFADVYEYTSVDDAGDRIALKLTKDNDAKAIREAVTELDIHEAAYGDGSPQVIGLEGKVRLPDGRLGIAVEIAPNGNAYEMSDIVSGAIDASPTQGSGKISQAEANILRLTMLRDMALGLQHLHDGQGVTHYDFKSPNCFVGEDGTIKVADFGLSLETDETTGLGEAATIDNPFFKAPELARAEDVKGRIKGFAKDTYKAEMTRETARIATLLPNASNQVHTILARSVMETRRSEIDDDMRSDQSMLFFDRKVDIWGMGASAVRMFNGSMPLQHFSFFYQAVEKLGTYGANRLNEPLSDPGADGNPTGNAIALKTGNAEIDKLLRAMLLPDPRDRASAAELLGMPVLNGRGVGSAEAKALMVALKSGDAAAIDRARQALSAVT